MESLGMPYAQGAVADIYKSIYVLWYNL